MTSLSFVGTSNSTLKFVCWIVLELIHPVSICELRRFSFQLLEESDLDARVVRGQSEVEGIRVAGLHQDDIGSYRNCLSRLAIVSCEDSHFKF